MTWPVEMGPLIGSRPFRRGEVLLDTLTGLPRVLGNHVPEGQDHERLADNVENG